MNSSGSPFVSVIIPYRNLGRYVEETLRSVFRQSYSEFEVVIVDDGTDESESMKVLDSIGASYPSVRIIRQSHRGVAAARNAGIAAARGEYIVPLDADDLIEPTYLEKCLWFLETHPAVAYVYTGVRHFGAIDAVCMDEFDFERLKTYNFITVTSMFRKRHFEEVGGYGTDTREGGYEDWDFWLSMGERGHYGALIPEPLFSYRRRSDSRLAQSLTQHDQIMADLREKLPSLYRERHHGSPGPGAPIPDAGARSISTTLDYLAGQSFETRMRIRNSIWFAHSPQINLLCIFPWLEIGGADLVNLNIVQRLNPALFSFSILTTLKSPNRWYDKFYALTPHIYSLANFIPEKYYVDFLLYFIESRRIDIVLVSNSMAGFNMLPFIRKHCPSVKILDLQHMEEPHWWGGGYPRIGSYFDRYLDKRITVSAYLKRYIVSNYGINPDKVEVIHNGVECRHVFNPDKYPPGEFRKELGIAPGAWVITMIGRLCEQKQPLTFVRIAHELLRRRGRGDLFFVIVGDGELRGETESLLCELGLGHCVKITGYRNDICRILRDTDLLVQPSANEGFPIVALEAMSMRVPVIIPDVGGIGELIDGGNGVLVDRNDPRRVDAFCDAIQRLIDDPGACGKFKDRARETVMEKFDADKMVKKYERVFLGLMKGRNG